ncbi:ArsR/SmtB family transcription factor [Levilactobacillus bambusae]|uniref:Transcriptional regulator n=1 Tax=Levilactobacillus bambusae TaxID=2024736 RepID=A0A2V1MZH6_9LACO|nr:metalloregulator ArsR/SmtB family transcription factor [Levilactobacillus bambusae]PWF99499.1 transcriptional regulator [Levilactobacillus bambusae]
MSERSFNLFKAAEPSLSMMSDPNRQRIILYLCDQPLTVNQLTEKLNLSRPAVSHHLKLLLTANLVRVDQVGTERYYENNMEPTIQLLRDLADSLEKDSQ